MYNPIFFCLKVNGGGGLSTPRGRGFPLSEEFLKLSSFAGKGMSKNDEEIETTLRTAALTRRDLLNALIFLVPFLWKRKPSRSQLDEAKVWEIQKK